MGLDLYALREEALSREAMKDLLEPVRQLRTHDLIKASMASTAQIWDLPELRARCPDFWESNRAVRDIIDRLIAERRDYDRRETEWIEGALQSQQSQYVNAASR